MKSFRKMLNPAQAGELTDEQRRWLIALGYMMPIAGAESIDDSGGDDSGDDGGDDGGQGDGGDDDEMEVVGEDDDDEDEGASGRRRAGADDLDEDETRVSKTEFERLKRIAKQAETARKKAEREAERRKEQEKRDAGNWEELLRERDEKIAEIEADKEAARIELDTTMRNQRIQAAATRLNYRDPLDAQHFLSEDETMDEAATERALKRLAREKPYLVSERKSSGAPLGNGDGPGLTIEEIKRMNPDEVNARWAEVQAVMSSQGSSK